jgi:hypothetical protein
MNLYHVQYDSQSFWVEAETFGQAVDLWKAHVKVLWDQDYMDTDQPESVHLVHDEPVIRAVTRPESEGA